jgi:fused signal recognition particle receptor
MNFSEMSLVVIAVIALLLVAFAFWYFSRKPQKKVPAPEPTTLEPSPRAEPSARPGFRRAILAWIPLLQSKTKDQSQWEEALIESDMGPRLTAELLSGLKNSEIEPLPFLKSKLTEIISPAEKSDEPWKVHNPWVVFLIGVNGVGKTTTVVKLAHFFRGEGLSVGVIGADTFRKAAVEQLERGVQKVNAEFFTLLGAEGSEGADPAAVVFDGLRKFKDKNVILVDTSGRLHTKTNLMEELKKMKRVATKAMASAPNDLWLIMDSTLGQNTVPQAKSFHEAVGLTGMVLTKLDGLGRGGTVFQLFRELGLPIRFLGVGEGISDLKPFKSSTFVEDLFDQATSSS